MALFKALFPGVILTLVVAIIIGSTGSHGGFLDIFRANIHGQTVYWSWPMFCASTGLSWGIIAIMK
ncbi:MAG: hypothetical protein M0R03_01040 [Novosphingobium sp.]|nr:hypothetical protein [Novosphingobium sp.]